MKTLAFVRDLFRKFPLLLVGNVVLLIVESLLGAVALFTIAPIIDSLVNPAAQHSSLITNRAVAVLSFFGLPTTIGSFLVVFLCCQVIKNGFMIFARRCLLRTKYAIQRDLLIGTFEDFFGARWLFFSSSSQATIFSTFVRELGIVGDAFGAMGMFFASALQLIVYLLALFYLTWEVTSISLAVALLVASPFLLLGKISYRLGKLNTSTANEIGVVIHESLSLAKIILGFGKQQERLQKLEKAFDAHRLVTLKAQTLGIAVPLLYEPLSMVALVVAVFTAQKLAMPLSDIAVLVWAFRNSIVLLSVLTAQKTLLENFFPSYEQIINFRRRARELKQECGEIPFTGFREEIVVDDLTFAFPGHPPTLVDVNMRIPKGKMIAVVGESGVGKSTLIDLIMGFNLPASGQVKFDGIPLQKFEINSYRRRIGYVPQEGVLFNMTIRDNLRWANEAASDGEIRQACKLANADEFIERLPGGYDTLVGDRGVRMSGGQRQRIALARAILRKPDLLILDEATSSLDSQSERLIQQAIGNVSKETTVIVIAHRLSTIIDAGCVYVLKGGTIVEEGTYRELVCKNGYFTRMMQMQALGAAR